MRNAVRWCSGMREVCAPGDGRGVRTVASPCVNARIRSLVSLLVLSAGLGFAAPVHAQDAGVNDGVLFDPTAVPEVPDSKSLLNSGADRGGYVPGGDPRIPHPATVPTPKQLLTAPADVEWTQILSTQRVSGQFNTIEIDQSNPNRIFVGTEEATVVRSDDGGITWEETELRPLVIQTRQVQVPTRPILGGDVFEGIVTVLQTPGAMSLFEYPRLGLDEPLEYQIFPDDIANEVGGQVPTTLDFEQLGESGLSPIGDSTGSYVDTFYVAGDLERRDAFLTRAVRGRKFETSPVRMIAFCPGNDFPILAVTLDELYGSPDDGSTWVRLLAIPGNLKMHRVRCAPSNPKHVLVSTDFGLFYSENGGTSFDQEFTGLPGDPSYAAGYGPVDPKTGTEIAYIGLDSLLFRGHPGSADGMRWTYPIFNDPSTAPWKRINSVIVTPDGQIWLATGDGVRMSRDGGDKWEVVAPFLFNAHNVQQVIYGGNEKGDLRIAVFVDDCPEPALRRPGICRNGFVYATDDAGKSWFPYFVGMSRRHLAWLGVTPFVQGTPGKWWVATSGEVFTNASAFAKQVGTPTVDREAMAWAKERLAKNIGLFEAKELCLDHYRVSPKAMNALWSRARKVAYIPDVRALWNLNLQDSDFTYQHRPMEPFDYDRTAARYDWNISIQFRWYLFAAVAYFADEFDPNDSGEENETRAELYELRRQLDFIVEDTWHERVMLLQHLAQGMNDRYQIEVTQERIETLELILEFWMGEPLPSVRRSFW